LGGIRPVDWTKGDNIERTNAVIESLVAEFTKPEYEGTVVSVEALNEPAGYDQSAGISATDNNGPLRKYYQQS
jgi:aryl-phospho-beta-D-glucosidase BglC (GH1 family)